MEIKTQDASQCDSFAGQFGGSQMFAHQIMTRHVTTVGVDTPIQAAARMMIDRHISGLPVVDPTGRVIGIVSEGDLLRRREIGTQHRRPRWLQFLVGSGRSANDFVHERGRKVGEIMSDEPVTVVEETPLQDLVALMEKKGIKRLPVLRGSELVGIVTRSDILRAVASVAREIPGPVADDEQICDRVTQAVDAADWRPLGLRVSARNGVVHLHGVLTDERARQAAIVAAENVAGVNEVHDHLCSVDTYTGLYLESAEDEAARKAPRELAK
jgi:CBS domain-containing protein